MQQLIYKFSSGFHSILIEKNNGKIYSFGLNDYGQLGLGDTNNRNTPTLINYSFNGKPIDIQQGRYHSLILTDTGKVYSFGRNNEGQLGLGNTTNKTTPTLINYSFNGKPIRIDQGGYYSLILTDTGKVYSFGQNNYGQLGLGDTSNRNTPTLINYSFNGKPIDIQVGYGHSLILTDTGKVYSFGYNDQGQLGIGNTTNKTTPTLINYSFNGIVKNQQGGEHHSILLTSNNKVYSFGDNRNGQLGIGNTTNKTTPTLINYQFDGNIIDIQSGYWQCIILTDKGKPYSFGRNGDGELGVGDWNNRTTPTLINYSFNGKPIDIQQGQNHMIILTDTGKAYSFGRNDLGMLGLGDTTNRNTPTLIPNFEVLVPILYKLLLYKDNNYYYQNPDNGNINLIGPIISYEDFENYGIIGIGNMINIQNIINNNYSILQYYEDQTSSSNISSKITYIPNNQLIKMQDYIFTQDFSNIDKITLNQSNLNILNNELITYNQFNYSTTGLENEFELITTDNLLNNTIININNITFNHTSNNVNIGILTSFDNETWQYYNGEEFISENLTNPTNLNTMQEIQSLFTNYNVINLNELYFQFIIEYLDETSSFTLNSINLNITNDSQLKILLSNQDDSWYGIDLENNLVSINLDNKSDIYNYGLNISKFNNIYTEDQNFWNKFQGGTNKIKFQFYLSINDIQEKIDLDLLTLQADISGVWKLQKLYDSTNQTGDYDLELSDKFIRVNIYSDGSYKINYNFIDIEGPGNLISFTQTDNGDNSIQLNWIPPQDYDYNGILILRSDLAYPSDKYQNENTLTVYNGKGTSYLDTNNIQSGKTYYYTQFPYDIRFNFNETQSPNNRQEVTIP